MKYFFFTMILISSNLFAETDPNEGTLNGLRQTGDLVSIKIIPGKPLQFMVVGKEGANLDLSNLKLKVKRINPGPEKIIATKRSGNIYSLREPVDENKPTDLEITAQTKEKEQSFRFHVNDRK